MADVLENPGLAILVGSLAGFISCFGFCRIQGWVERKIGLSDTCGILYLHGIPGLLGALVSWIVYGSTKQWNNQAQATIITILIAIFSGAFAGVLTKYLVPNMTSSLLFNDELEFIMPDNDDKTGKKGNNTVRVAPELLQ